MSPQEDLESTLNSIFGPPITEMPVVDTRTPEDIAYQVGREQGAHGDPTSHDLGSVEHMTPEIYSAYERGVQAGYGDFTEHGGIPPAGPNEHETTISQGTPLHPEGGEGGEDPHIEVPEYDTHSVNPYPSHGEQRPIEVEVAD